MKISLAYAVLTLGLATLAAAQGPPAASSAVAATLQPPAGAKLLLQAHATGWQVYTCTVAADGKAQWTLKGPDADLHDAKGVVIGHHFAGPKWHYQDGSEVTGKAVAHTDAPDGRSIPWLLLTAVDHAGEGLFAHVTSIQRLHTQGGQAPAATDCDAGKAGAESRSQYSADYSFFQ